MTEVVMDAEAQIDAQIVEGTGKCPQPGCLRGYPHEGVRHRYAPTKDLQPEPERVPLPVPDERPFAAPVEARPTNHAFTVIDEKRGLYVAWSQCGACHMHITICTCSSGPRTPEYIQRWRDEKYPINDPQKVVEKHTQSTGRTIDRVRTATDQDRAATHICDSCGELLYLLDTPDGKRAFTVRDDNNYCTADDDLGIHLARDITQADRDANPDWFPGDEDEDQQWAEEPDLPDAARTDEDPVEQTPVQTDNSNIDPEVGF